MLMSICKILFVKKVFYGTISSTYECADRNESSHRYDPTMAYEIATKADSYRKAMEMVLKRM
jgi:hypothetical protein